MKNWKILDHAAIFIALALISSFVQAAQEISPIDERLNKAISANSAMAMKSFSNLSGEKFDYSKKSVAWVSGFIDRNRSEPPGNLVDVIGSYLGEAIVHTYKGKWVTFQNMPAVQLRQNFVVFPFSKVHKQFENGAEDSISSFFVAIPALLADWEAENASNK